MKRMSTKQALVKIEDGLMECMTDLKIEYVDVITRRLNKNLVDVTDWQRETIEITK
jgi:hypothetical protein